MLCAHLNKFLKQKNRLIKCQKGKSELSKRVKSDRTFKLFLTPITLKEFIFLAIIIEEKKKWKKVLSKKIQMKNDLQERIEPKKKVWIERKKNHKNYWRWRRRAVLLSSAKSLRRNEREKLVKLLLASFEGTINLERRWLRLNFLSALFFSEKAVGIAWFFGSRTISFN